MSGAEAWSIFDIYKHLKQNIKERKQKKQRFVLRIDQVTSHFGANKSIDQEILIFQDIIRSLGYESNIYANVNQTPQGE